MTLRRKMAYQIAATIAALLLISGAALWGITGLHSDFGQAIQGYQSLRDLYDASSHISTARTLLTLSRQAEPAAIAEIRRGMPKFEAMLPESSELSRSIRGELREALRELELSRVKADPQASHPAIAPLSQVLEHIDRHAVALRGSIQQTEAAARSRRRTTLMVVGTLAMAITLAAILIGLSQYRSVTRPLQALSGGVRRLAEKRFSDRIVPQGNAEFVALADDFNRMADQLDALYRDLESKVAQKSGELVRSERLASVGYLAAGVAHEISNPIGIIAGYAEFTLQQIRQSESDETNAETENALRIICEEAFRCKQIVARLLSLARPGDENRRRISLAEVASNVVSIVAGLKENAGRQLKINAQADSSFDILASEGEMKQVLLNLTLNALQAVEPERGMVDIDLAARNGTVELSVTDNGRGMSPAILEHVFEPFFTAQRGATAPGTGLGLSITHAIVTAHGGRITAHSDGPGRGSRFTVQFPTADGGSS